MRGNVRLTLRTGTLGALTLAAAALSLASLTFAAQPTWTKARGGAFETVSDDGRRSATQALSQFEQFRYALGTVLGKPDLRLDPPIRILIFRNAAALAAEDCAGIRQGRERLIICAVSEGQLPPDTLKALTRYLLQNNFSAMPGPIETALESFFSTIESKATRVAWGTPPPVPERTREWAMLHRIVTQPDYAGKARIFLHNLAGGMDRPSAIRNAFGEDAARFEADTDKYFEAGVFTSAPAPSRPINPDKDFSITSLTSDEGLLMRADLLTGKSGELYSQLLGMGKHIPEANEGLGLLAVRNGNSAQAMGFFQTALDAGSKNVVMITANAGLQEDTAKAVKLLQSAVAIDSKYAPARWMLGEKSNDPRIKLMQWKQATALAPRNAEWWVRYARLCLDQKQFAEAGRAWLAAAQAAPDAAHREEYLTARGKIDEQRLHSDDEIRRKEQETQARDLEQLKNKARQEIADMEARANGTAPISYKDAVFDWTEVNGKSVTGTLDTVDCAGKLYRLHLSTADSRKLMFLVRNPAKLEFPSERMKLSCTGWKPRQVTLTYTPVSQAPVAGRNAFDGEVTSIDPH